MRVVTNFPGFPAEWQAANGVRGRGVVAQDPSGFMDQAGVPGTVLMVDCNPGLAMAVAARRGRRGRPPPVVALDLVLRRPRGLIGLLSHPLKRHLLGRVDRFIHYFADTSALDRVYGLAPERSAYVPFKANLPPPDPGLAMREEYCLCFGRSLRDYDTFFAAIDQLPWPAAIPAPDPVELRRHGARFSRPLDRLPATLTCLADDGSAAAQAAMLARARIVVLPILGASLVASGISTALNAMLYGKCVIGTRGPGGPDIFPDQALFVPPEDPAALAAMIDRVWRDDALRHRTAAAGAALARAWGGQAALTQRLIDRLAEWYG